MTGRQLAVVVALVVLASAATGIVVHVADDSTNDPTATSSSSIGVPSTAIAAETTATTAAPGLDQVRAGCQIVNDTIQRATADADAYNAKQTQLAHPAGPQDVWTIRNQSDLGAAIELLQQAAEVDARWFAIESTVDSARSALDANALTSRVDRSGAVSAATAACLDR